MAGYASVVTEYKENNRSLQQSYLFFNEIYTTPGHGKIQTLGQYDCVTRNFMQNLFHVISNSEKTSIQT